jgi:toxin ParE1/3/4
VNQNNKYVLHPKADEDIEKIWYYSATNWSVDRADQEVDTLHWVFTNISIMPNMGREWVEINPPVRIHTHGSHVIVYRIENDIVTIVRVLGGRQNWLLLLTQGES